MTQNPPAPELVEAYRLIKAEQKSQAGKILQAYIAHTKDDAQAWWLMSHAVSNPVAARRCLETVLKLDPGHEKARAQLAKLSQATQEIAPPAQEAVPQRASRPASRPARPVSKPAPKRSSRPASRLEALRSSRPAPRPAPSVADDADFPSDELVLAGLVVSTASRTVPAAPAAPTTAPAAPASSGSFEDFLHSDQPVDPFAGPPIDDPFAPAQAVGDPFVADPFAPAAHVDDPFAPASYDPFAAANVFDPSAGVHLGQQTTTQAAGTGNQPVWGPGLAFVADSKVEIGGAPDLVSGGGTGRASIPRPGGGPTPILTGDDLRVIRRRSRSTNAALLAAGGIIATVIVAGLLYLVISWVNGREKVPSMTTMDAAAFSIDYPKGWDQRCESVRGYPVCGMANHRWYNEVDYFAGTDIDLGQMFGDLFGSAFTGENVPEEAVSIITMDVPRNSPAYDDASWAKTLYEWDFGENPTYHKKTMQIDGYEAFYYEFKSKNRYYTWAAWDVYILHDDVVFWLRIDFSGNGNKTIPQKMVDKMIKSIDIK